MCEKYFKKIEELTQDYIKVWEDVCNIESPTDLKERVDAVGDYFVKMANERGWEVEYCKQEVSGDAICITMNPESKKAPIALSGHMDTVHPVGLFGTPAVRKDSEKIYGPGVTDCKGGIVAAFFAMDVLQRGGFKDRPVKLLLQSDEEKSSMPSHKSTVKFMCEKAKDAAAFINLEMYTQGKCVIERKGIVTYLFEVEGVSAHAAHCDALGSNAILEASHKIIEIEKIKDGEGITCCCSVINGGTTPNTVPQKCEFKVNVRYRTHEQFIWVEQFMKEIAEKNFVQGCKTSLSIITQRVAMEYCEKNVKLLEAVNKSFSKNGLPNLDAMMSKGGSDAADVTFYGIPCLDSLGIYGGEIHSKNEFAFLDSLAESTKRIVSIIDYI